MPIFSHGGHILKDLGSHAAVQGISEIEWLLLDRFDTDRAAGAINATLSEPSGHPRTMTDSVPNAVITGGQYKVTAVAAIRNPWLRYADGWARAAGRMLRLDASANNIAADNWLVGLANTLTTPAVAQTLGAVFGATTIKAGLANTQVVAYTPGTDTEIVVVLRATGYFLVIDGKLRWIHRAGTTATLYPHVAGLAADAAMIGLMDDIGIADLPLTNPTLFPTPTLSDTFSDTVAPLLSDGLAHIEAGGVNGAGVQWNGVGTFSNLANKAYIAPTPGAELLTNGDFSAWTADNPDGWTVLGEVGADPEVSEVGAAEGHGGVGAGAANFYSSVTNGLPEMRQSNTYITNEFNRVAVVVSALVSGAFLIASLGTAITITGTGTANATGRTSSPVSSFKVGTAPSDITIDSISAKALTFADCLRAAAPASAGEPYVSAKLTITANTQAGMMINLDDYSNPQYGVHVWYDRINSKVYARKLVAGVWQADSVAGVAATYSAGAYAEPRRIGDEVTIFYNGAFVASFDAANVPTTNTLVALFATDSASYFEAVTSFPTDGFDHSAYA